MVACFQLCFRATCVHSRAVNINPHCCRAPNHAKPSTPSFLKLRNTSAGGRPHNSSSRILHKRLMSAALRLGKCFLAATCEFVCAPDHDSRCRSSRTEVYRRPIMSCIGRKVHFITVGILSSIISVPAPCSRERPRLCPAGALAIGRGQGVEQWPFRVPSPKPTGFRSLPTRYWRIRQAFFHRGSRALSC